MLNLNKLNQWYDNYDDKAFIQQSQSLMLQNKCNFKIMMRNIANTTVMMALHLSKGNINQTAKYLNINRYAVRYYLKSMGLYEKGGD
tara:strand:+ start:1053 stop:1313 length:261 start_codon:yes stop_codon:yes gene_type:complete